MQTQKIRPCAWESVEKDANGVSRALQPLVAHHVFYQVGCVKKTGVKIISRVMQVREFVKTNPTLSTLTFNHRFKLTKPSRSRLISPPFRNVMQWITLLSSSRARFSFVHAYKCTSSMFPIPNCRHCQNESQTVFDSFWQFSVGCWTILLSLSLFHPLRSRETEQKTTCTSSPLNSLSLVSLFLFPAKRSVKINSYEEGRGFGFEIRFSSAMFVYFFLFDDVLFWIFVWCFWVDWSLLVFFAESKWKGNI